MAPTTSATVELHDNQAVAEAVAEVLIGDGFGEPAP
jgi:hypothetical protein